MKIAMILLLWCASVLMHGKSIEVQGHRGTRGLRPENTLPSFAEAIRVGADVLELDLLMTQDGKIVIYHDYFLNPDLLTYLDGKPLQTRGLLVHSLPLSAIKQFDCGRKIHPVFPRQESIPGTLIPTLDELFEMIQNSSDPQAKTVRLNLEIKREAGHPEYSADPQRMAQAVLDLVRKRGFEERVSYSSFDPETLFALRALDKKAKIAFLKEDNLDRLTDVARQVDAQTVSPRHSFIRDAQQVRSLQEMGFKVVLWTVNDPMRWEQLLAMGVDGIITDYPEDLIHFIDKRRS
jgi:glycerophosphoryl diester phosphodiesterase